MPRRAPSPVQTRLLDSLADRLEQLLVTTSLVSRISKAVVTSSSGTLVTVAWRGTDIAVPYLTSYTPAVGDVVAVAKTGSQLLILGRIVGTP